MTIPDSAAFLFNSGASCLPLPPEEEARIVADLHRQSEAALKPGDLFYVLSAQWWSLWRKYVGLDDRYCQVVEPSVRSHSSNGFLSKNPTRPGIINNLELIWTTIDAEGDVPEIRSDLVEGNDYVLVAAEIWKKLAEWYTGGPALPRKMIVQGPQQHNLVVELYPLRLHLVNSSNDEETVIRISKKATVQDLIDSVCITLKLEHGKVHIWDYFERSKCKQLIASDQSLEEAQLQMDQHILVESETDKVWYSSSGMDSTGNELALVPVEPSRSPLSIAGGPSISKSSDFFGTGSYFGQMSDSREESYQDEFLCNSDLKGEFVKGLTGLQNLGNTCFMNSALQCLAHTPAFVDYFLHDYNDEINTENPLGLKGELAIAFGELLRKLWSSGKSPVAPRPFKAKLARFAPQFSGYNQHDSQELLAFLLDGLHEDLNRVKNKPYIEAKDSDGRPDDQFADECWADHKARNDSVIVDVCQGQYKSTLVCPACGKVSVTFDPFMYLSVPLSSTVTRSMTITVFYGNGSGLPMPYTVHVLKHGTVKDLTLALSTACCLEDSESLVIAEVFDHKIYKFLDDPSESLIGIRDEEHFVAYRLPANQSTLIKLVIMHRQKERYSYYSLDSLKSPELFGAPVVTCLPDLLPSTSDIQEAVNSAIAPFLRVKIKKESSCNGREEVGNGIDRVLCNGNRCSSPENDLLSCDGMELDSDSYPDLWVMEDSRICNRLENVFYHGTSRRLDVVMDWSDKEHELYDPSFLKDLPVVFKAGSTAKKTRQDSISLFSCLESYLKEEPLGPDDMWYCPSCKTHRQATKKLDLWQLPDILIFHLKRFSYSRYLKNKLDTFVNFPVRNLDLTKYVKNNSSPNSSHIYELYAVSNHYGGLGGGHYTAHAKMVKEDKWYHFDDSHVSPATEDSVKTAAAYVLFYRRIRSDAKMEVDAESSEAEV